MENMIVCVIAGIICVYLCIMQVIDLRRYKHEEDLNDAFESGYEWGRIAEREKVVHVNAILVDE